MTIALRQPVAFAAVAALGACTSLRREPGGTAVRVMSYNIRSGNGNLDGTAGHSGVRP
jgi:hypothetical protein